MNRFNLEQAGGSTGGYAVFADVSLNPRLRHGVGAGLVVPAEVLEMPTSCLERSEIAGHIMIKRFEGTSSTTLEVQTVVWMLDEYRKTRAASDAVNLRIYTDSQCVAGLLGRRQRLERADFKGAKTGSPIRNTDLYRKFYTLFDRIGFEIVKVHGHTRKFSRTTIDHIFAFVDKEARKALKLIEIRD